MRARPPGSADFGRLTKNAPDRYGEGQAGAEPRMASHGCSRTSWISQRSRTPRRFHLAHPAEYTRTMTRVIFVLWMVAVAQAQTPAPATPTLETLLKEVHQLRLVLERSAQIAPRIQIAVERLKLQQEKAGRTAQQLDELRRELERVRSEQPK